MQKDCSVGAEMKTGRRN